MIACIRGVILVKIFPLKADFRWMFYVSYGNAAESKNSQRVRSSDDLLDASQMNSRRFSHRNAATHYQKRQQFRTDV